MIHRLINGGLRQELVLLFFVLLIRPLISDPVNIKYSDCLQMTRLNCSSNSAFKVSFPFGSASRPSYCSHPGYQLACMAGELTTTIGSNNKPYFVKGIDYGNRVLTVSDPNLQGDEFCPLNFSIAILDFSLYSHVDSDQNITLYFNCSSFVLPSELTPVDCGGKDQNRSYYELRKGGALIRLGLKERCEYAGAAPICEHEIEYLKNKSVDMGRAVKEGFGLEWTAGFGWCGGCIESGGVCGYDEGSPGSPTCFCPNTTSLVSNCHIAEKSNGQNILVGVTAGVAGAGLIVACFVCLLFYRRKRRRDRSSSSKPLVQTLSSMRDTELGSGGTHIFSYDELREATNCFDASLELGDGGFGTVYKGKLRDGRVVAVKRLYENNYKRAEQFINEVDILSRLRHQNLVTLYGCTSRRSRELLLVYEFVSNGTVADHLHGSRSSDGALAWAHRMRIAVETADALAYLHAVEPQIIHRDVKTTNILLDDGFHVKMGDFGLSRLFPLDATHVSTLPQGTPGYVDPEYHQCYQLTDKSDVYSFGVVLVELISSKPAVDISRSRNEINLSSMAINRIRNRELDQLVDPELGFHYDEEKKRMITRVADLAFRCLQAEKEMRPSIKEVLEELQRIVSGGCEEDKDPGVEEESVLLKSVLPFSPDSVTVRWDSSRSTTSNTSTG